MVPALDEPEPQQVLCRDQNSASATPCPAAAWTGSGFVALMTWINQAICEAEVEARLPRPGGAASRCDLIGNLTLSQRAKDGYTYDNASVIQPIAVMMIVMGYAPLVQFLMVHMVGEGERGIREALFLMGMRKPVYWMSWSIEPPRPGAHVGAYVVHSGIWALPD